jgi:hypothetical protein
MKNNMRTIEMNIKVGFDRVSGLIWWKKFDEHFKILAKSLKNLKWKA